MLYVYKMEHYFSNMRKRQLRRSMIQLNGIPYMAVTCAADFEKFSVTKGIIFANISEAVCRAGYFARLSLNSLTAP